MHGSVSRRLLVVGALVLLGGVLMRLTSCSSSAGSGPVDGNKAMAHVKQLVACNPRPAGSPGLAKAADYLSAELKALGLNPQRDEFVHPQEKITIRNVWAQIDGADPVAGPILVLGAHYDAKLAAGHKDEAHNFPFQGAIDGGGAPAVLLELARVLTKDPKYRPRVNVWLYFIDGEESVDWEWNDAKALLGSKHFVKVMGEDQKLFPNGMRARMKAFVLLDLIGSRDFKIDRDTNSNDRLQNLFATAAGKMKAADRVYEFKSGITDDHNTFTNAGVPSVLLIDFEHRIPKHLQKRPNPTENPRFHPWWHTAEDKIENMAPAALAFTGNLVLQAWPDLEAFCGIK